MKICLISNLYNPYAKGGAEVYVDRLAKALSERYEVFVITTRPFNNLFCLFPQPEFKQGLKIYRFYPLNLFCLYFIGRRRITPLAKVIWRIIDLFNWHSVWAVLHVLKRERPDIVHTHNLGGLSFSCLLAIKVLGIPLVHTLHDYHLLCPYAGYLVCPYTKFRICKRRPFPCKIYSVLKKMVVDSIPEIVIGPSRFITDMHKGCDFFKNSQFFVLPNFIDINREPVVQKKTEQTLDILFVGRLFQPKGVHILIGAFRQLKGDFLRLHIVGDGPQKRTLEDLARTDGRIKFYGEADFYQLKGIYSCCDVLVVPSIWYENFPTVILEAFCYGLPVIGSRIGGIPEQVVDNYNGFLFPPGDKHKLKEKIEIIAADFKSDGALLKRLRQNAHQSTKRYSRDIILGRLIELYNSSMRTK